MAMNGTMCVGPRKLGANLRQRRISVHFPIPFTTTRVFQVQLFQGAGYVLKGLSLIAQPGLRRFVAVPLLVNALLFAVLIGYGALHMQDLLAYIDGLMPRAPDLGGWLSWLTDFIAFLLGLVEWLLWTLFGLAALFVVFYAFSVVGNLIAAPFNSLLAEKVERHLTGRPLDEGDTWSDALKSIVPALLSEMRKLIYIGLRAIPLLILSFIPVLNIAAPFLWALFGAWMLALEYMDYPMANHGILFSEQRTRLKQKRMLSLGFGGLTMGMTLIPVVNFLAMPTAVAGATALWVERLNKEARPTP